MLAAQPPTSAGYDATAVQTDPDYDMGQSAVPNWVLIAAVALLVAAGLGPFTRTHIEVLGSESCFGEHAKTAGAREVIMRLTVMHPRKEALDLVAREVAPAGTSWSPGTTAGT